MERSTGHGVDIMSDKMNQVASDIDRMFLEIRQLQDEMYQLRSSISIIAERLAKESDEPLSKWT
jgi:outer membrane murein-binding lipoprotein Lpp